MDEPHASQPEPSSLSEWLTVLDADGTPVVKVVLLATVYFAGGHQPEVRAAVAECFERFQAVCGEHLRWAKHPQTLGWHRVDDPELPTPRQWLNQAPPNTAWQLYLHGGDQPEACSDFVARGLGSPGWENLLSYFSVALPLDWYADHPGSFRELVGEFCRRLQPVSGYGGFGIMESPASARMARQEPEVRRLAERFPGLEVDRPYTHTLYLDKGIKGVNWLTILGKRWLQEAGGEERLREALPPPFVFDPYPGGLLIQAGRMPQTGGMATEPVPPLYQTINRVLQPISIRKHRAFHYDGLDRFDKAASERWLGRFDR